MVKFKKTPKLYGFLSDIVFIPGTTIIDRRYTDSYKAKKVIKDYTCPMYKGHILMKITFSDIKKTTFESKTENSEDMEKRNVTLTLKQAREWYNSNNKTLREVALQVYTKEELKELKEPQSWEELAEVMGIHHISMKIVGRTPDFIISRQITLMKLAIAAEYLNKGETLGDCSPRYFIGRKTYSPSNYNPVESLNNGYYIYGHASVTYPGIVYFKDIESAKKAFNMLKYEILALN